LSRYVLTARAERDLLAIFLQSIELFGVPQARRYRDSLKNCFELIAGNPDMGRPASRIGEGVRRHEHQSHIILYDKVSEGVRILALVPSKSVRLLKL
jgi:toxin ParE1/3/4